MPELLRATESLCPDCLEPAPARLLAEGDDVYLEGCCMTHGDWRTLIWAGPPSFESWCGPEPAPPARQTCTAVLEVTRNCDLGCPFCFAESTRTAEAAAPWLSDIVERLGGLFASEGAVNLQLSGGEPTTRPDLDEIVAAATAAGFSFVQLNTNGLRLSAEPGYAETLQQAGLKSVFLQFDTLDDGACRVLRGRPLVSAKVRAIERCAEAGLAVVLVPTVVGGVNADELGALVRFAASWPGVVRGLHLQPVSYFGRYPLGSRPRLTLPEVIRALEQQTGGEVSATDFRPSCCEHARCSFRARYWVREGARLELVRSAPSCCTPTPADVPQRAVAATSRQWGPQRRRAAPSGEAGSRDGLDRFLEDADRMLTISGMLFQDAWTIDMERIGRCCVQVVTKESVLVPFCLWNVTSQSGKRLHQSSTVRRMSCRA
jgi:7,8-dihydro-6-hydroxymethylpterin dimethyltransferase